MHHWGFISEAHPEQVVLPSDINIDSISCGHSQCFAVSDTGDVFTWGGTAAERDPETKLLRQAVATKIAFPEPIKTVSVGFLHSIFVAKLGSVYVLGEGSRGQLGLGAHVGNAFEPTKVAHSISVVEACAGGHHSLIRDGTEPRPMESFF